MNHLKFPTHKFLTLNNGRKISYYEAGPSAGTPILFCTGAAMSGVLGFGISELEKLNIRLISPDRAGLGDSSPDLQKSLTSWADDMEEFICTLELKNPKAVGFSQGSTFAFILASRKLVSALAIVSGQDDFNNNETKSLLSEHVQPFISMIQDRNIEFIQNFKKTIHPEGFLEFIISMSSDVDKTLYSKEPFHSAYLESLSKGLKQGVDHYVLDLISAMNKWPFKLEDISVPVQLWYGGKDTSTVHSPDFGKTLYARLPNAERFFLDDQGGSILWTKSYEILKKLIASN